MEIFQKLANKQKPHTLMITCVDSRITPEKILGIEPGEVLCLRNIASLVAKQGLEPSTESTIEFATMHLGIQQIIVMSHSNCGGISTLLHKKAENSIKKWLEPWDESLKQWLSAPHSDPEQHCQHMSVIESINNIRNMSFINNNICVKGWHFDIPSASIFEYNEKDDNFSLME